MHQLKITSALRDFELPHEHEEEKLKFSFARCLEAAVGRSTTAHTATVPSSKRRRYIDVLVMTASALNRWCTERHAQARRLRRRSRHDTSLPPSPHDSHTILELRRRRLVSFIVVEPLDEISRRGLDLYNRTATIDHSPLSLEEQEAVVTAPGSANPLYLRLLLQGQELFEVGSPDRAAWLERVTRASEIHGVYELLIRRWNDILSEDLHEQLHKLTSSSPSETVETATSEHKIVRRSTKRDVNAGGDSSSTNNQQAHSGPHALARGPSKSLPLTAVEMQKRFANH